MMEIKLSDGTSQFHCDECGCITDNHGYGDHLFRCSLEATHGNHGAHAANDNIVAAAPLMYVMKYPKKVQEKIDFLAEYTIDETLKTFHIFHLYPQGLAYPDGYYDSRFFELWGYNESTMEKRKIGICDGFNMEKSANISLVRIFADGSTMIVMEKPCKVIEGGSVIIFCE